MKGKKSIDPELTFKQQKESAYKKDDKSKIGMIDKDIKQIVDFINSLDNYYTTSSCSGRIVLLQEPINSKKSLFKWLYVSHGKGNEKDLLAKIIQLKETEDIPEEIVRLRSEPFIIHICCKNLEDANRLLNIAFNSGLKRSGIIMLNKRIMLEIMGSNFLDTPISQKGKLYPDEEYLDLLINTAEKKLAKNHEQLDRFFENFMNEMKR